MPKANQHETEDREKPRRAAIYLSEPVPNSLDEPRYELSIDQQQVLCRFAAKALGVEVVDEFIDSQQNLAVRSGLHQAMEAVQTMRLDLLIVSSLERLGDDHYDLVKVAWQLGRAGTVPVPVEVGCENLPMSRTS